MESRPKNPEFRNNPENFHPCLVGCFLRMHTSSTPVENLCILCRKKMDQLKLFCYLLHW